MAKKKEEVKDEQVQVKDKQVKAEDNGVKFELPEDEEPEPEPESKDMALGAYLHQMWIEKVVQQLTNFIANFFGLFLAFVKDQPEFVEVLRDLDRLFGNDPWEGITIIKGGNFEIFVFINKMEFKAGADTFTLRLDLTDEEAGKQLSDQKELLESFLTEFVCKTGATVHLFPINAKEIIRNICSFNLRG